ncbi:unnamed protein product, partial [Staurois parvus]
MKKKDQIKEENLRKREIIKENKEQEKWNNLTSSLKKQLGGNFSSGISQLEKSMNSLQTHTVRYRAQLDALTMCFEIWIEHYKTVSEDKRDMNIAVEIMKTIQSIMANYKDRLQGVDKHRIATYLSQLGFQNLSCSLKDTERELLDVVDNNESAVIVAPTSSGKTYASYYCMEKVLKQSNDSVVVYVAPTKALVNQVVATVKSMFDKDLPTGMVLCGVFTRDYRTDALNCQVLVTVPQCLEILVLSPHRQDWVKKIKYLIFDEVHCLGGEIGAEVWEHLLVMIRCPFLALSATISNPEHLTEWLQSVTKYWQQNDERETSLVTNSSKKRRQNKR